MPKNKVIFNDKGLNDLIKEFNKKSYIKIGILGNKNNRDKGSNASIGLVHEEGSPSDEIPARSFLKMPLLKKLESSLGDLKVKEMKIILLLKKIGIKGEEIIQEAFDTGGFGEWQKLSQKTIDKKGFDKKLIETTQLRKSITSEVVE